ncbi:hypothetical protein HDU76_002017 [Blyttiomyces sp. JEL0837]|nr:hypothetical protein HDU76_002017 [Blyttiomyces sp. JEL0837]
MSMASPTTILTGLVFLLLNQLALVSPVSAGDCYQSAKTQITVWSQAYSHYDCVQQCQGHIYYWLQNIVTTGGGVQCACTDQINTSSVYKVADGVCQSCQWGDGGICGIEYQHIFVISLVSSFKPPVTVPPTTSANPAPTSVPNPVTSNTPDNPPPTQTTPGGETTGSNNSNGGDQQNPTSQPIDTVASQSTPNPATNHGQQQSGANEAPAQTTSPTPSSPSNGNQNNNSGSAGGTGSSSPQIPIAAIAGGVVGAVVVLLAVGSVVIWRLGKHISTGGSAGFDNDSYVGNGDNTGRGRSGAPPPYTSTVQVQSVDRNTRHSHSHNLPVNARHNIGNNAGDNPFYGYSLGRSVRFKTDDEYDSGNRHIEPVHAASMRRNNADNPFYGHSLGRNGTFRATGFDNEYAGDGRAEPVV